MAEMPGIAETAARRSLPSANFNPRPASPQDMGSGIGDAVSQLGQTGAQVAQSFVELRAREEAQQAEFRRQTGFTTMVTAETERLQTEARNLTDGQGFMQGFMRGDGTPANPGFDGRTQAFLATVPPNHQEEWRARIASTRGQLAEAALTQQFHAQDEFAHTQLGQNATSLATLVDLNPTPENLQTQQTAAAEAIHASGLNPNDQAAEMARVVGPDGLLARSYAAAMVRNNPQGVLSAINGANGTLAGDAVSSVKAAIRGHEAPAGAAGDRAANPNSSARGGYQLTTAWWARIISTPEGRAAGLTAAMRNDPAAQERAMDIAIPYYQSTLRAAGAPVTAGNMYMVHFMGDAGFRRMWSTMQLPGGGNRYGDYMFPDAARANRNIFYKVGPDGRRNNPRTLQEIYDLQTRNFSHTELAPTGQQAPTDPVIAGLSPDARSTLFDQANRAVQQNEQRQAAADQAAHETRLNTLLTGLMDGTAGIADVQRARRQGWLTSASEISQAEGVINQHATRDRNINAFNTAMATPGFQWNPFSDDQRHAVDAGVDALTGTPQERAAGMLSIYTRTGIVPTQLSTSIRGGLVSTNPQAVQSAANMAANMMARNPNAFAGVEGHEDIERAASAFSHFTNDMGYTADVAAQRVAEMNDPQRRRTIDARAPELTQFRQSLIGTPSHPLDYSTNLAASSRGWFHAGSVLPEQRSSINQTYADIATDHYQRYGDQAAARAYADQQMHRMFGVSNGHLMQYPPEHVYPQVHGSWSYIYEQARADIQQATGHDVPVGQITLVPMPTATADAWRSGRPAPYIVHYLHNVGGQATHDVLLRGAFVADPAAAGAAHHVDHQTHFNQQRAEAEYQRTHPRAPPPGTAGMIEGAQ